MTRNFNRGIKSLGHRNSIPSIELVPLNIFRILETKMGIFGVPRVDFTIPGRFDQPGDLGRSGPILAMWTELECVN